MGVGRGVVGVDGGIGSLVVAILVFPETRSHYVILTGLELRDLPASASSEMGLKLWVTTPSNSKHSAASSVNDDFQPTEPDPNPL